MLNKKNLLLKTLTVFFLCLAFTPTGRAFSFSAPTFQPQPRYVPGQVLVRYKNGAPLKQNEEVKQAVGLQRSPVGKINLKGPNDIYVYRLSSSTTVNRAVKDLSRNPEVELAEPNYIYRAAWVPNDLVFGRQWGLNNSGQAIRGSSGKVDADIDMPEAWSIERGYRNPVTVAVIDTGIEIDHPDLASKVDGSSYGFSNPLDNDGHGTHVSGIIAAATNNSKGVAGVAPGAKIMALKANDAPGQFTLSSITAAIYYAADNGAKVINMSFGGDHSSFLQEAVNYAYNKGVVQVAAAGNDGNSTLNYPAAYPNVIGVGATDKYDRIADFSNHNYSVDLSAPGVDIYSTTVPEFGEYIAYYNYMKGTSMAAPMVSGLAALILSKKPALTPREVEVLMEKTADDKGYPGWDDYYGYGRINAAKALDNKPPTVYLRTPSFSAGRSMLSERFKVKWGGSDNLSGLDSYNVLYKPGFSGAWEKGFTGAWSYWVRYKAGTWAYFTGAPGETYQFLMTSTDRAGKVSAKAKTLTVVPVDQNDPNIIYKGPWRNTKTLNSKFYRGNAKYSKRKGASLVYSFKRARAVRLIVTKRPNGGTAGVYLGSRKVAKVDFYSPTVRYRVPVFIKKFNVPADGKLTVRVRHVKNPSSSGYRVEIDGIAVRKWVESFTWD